MKSVKLFLSKLPLSTKVAGGFILSIVIISIFASWIAPFPYDRQDTLNSLASPGYPYWMGTDRLGRDLLSRIIYGARISLFVGIFTTVAALIIGVVYGTISGYLGGKIDSVMMRVVDVIFSLPDLLLIILITVLMGRGLMGIFIALTLVSWVTTARLVRGETLKLKESQFVEASRALGANHFRVMFREILPNLWGILIVTLSFRIPVAILSESTLSFVGLGIAPPYSSWGTLTNEGWMAVKFYPHLIVFPSLAIFITILSFNLFGDGLRDILDPKGKTE
jgi:oligopeptide transport system permease protein